MINSFADAYFLNLPKESLPYIHIPLHTIIKLTPKAYGCEESFIKVGIEAVDTHRPKANKHEKRSSYGDHVVNIGMTSSNTTTTTSNLSKAL